VYPAARVEGGEQAPESFDELVEKYRHCVFRYALLCLRDADAAETITQDCCLKAFQAFEAFRGECSGKTWLMGIAVNLVRDHIRNRRLQFWRRIRSRELPPLESFADCEGLGRSPEAMVARKEEIAAIWAAAEQLPERQRTVLLLRFVEEMDILEIVAATGMKEGTVKAHLFRAVRAVRARVAR